MRATTTAASLLASSLLYEHGAAFTTPIKWTVCEHNASIPIECGTLTVPLDYTDTNSDETIELQLVRVKAQKQPSRGSIIFNPGGPGEAGRDTITVGDGFGFQLSHVTGGYHDMISFDPRGTGQTIPFNCRGSASPRTFEMELGSPAAPNRTGVDSLLEEVADAEQEEAKNCSRTQRPYGDFIGTTFVVRDVMRIVDTLGGDTLLNYWGFSYGTVIGATAAAMFPDRMGRVVLDGVVNPNDYWAGREIEAFTDAEATFSGFFSGCIANASICALARDGWSKEKVQRRVVDFLQELEHDQSNEGLATYISLTSLIFNCLYSPISWPQLSRALEAAMTGDQIGYLENTITLPEYRVYPSDSVLDDALHGIRCGDGAWRTSDPAELKAMFYQLETITPTFGDAAIKSVIRCAGWEMRAKERYTADFQSIQTTNPLLIVGNTYDPITPLVSARNASAAFPGSVLLQSNTYGHTSLVQPSLCTA